MNYSLFSTITTSDKACYVYDYQAIQAVSELISSFHSSMFQSRYAMKANSNKAIMDIIRHHGIGIDCCSEYEVDIALDC